jgi:2-oxoglutarate ferredoxin oxidoreductase subunit beta
MVRATDFTVAQTPTWCPGCGDYGILGALKITLAELGLEPQQIFISSGIGCGSKLPDYIKVNGFMGIHGRALPVATGAKLSNHELVVIAVTGDGDGYGIGGNHLLHAMRRNLDITHLVENNQIYGLTKGQYSPTSNKGFVTKTTPAGSIEPPVNPLTLALAAGATFISRTFAGDRDHMVRVFKEAIQHRGYSLVDVLQPCVTFNKLNTYDWYRARIFDVEQSGHDRRNKAASWELAQLWGERIPIGVVYQEERPTYKDQEIALQTGPLVKRELRELSLEQIRKLRQEFI